MAKLTRQSIKARLLPMPVGVPPDYLELTSQGHTPAELKNALREGCIIIDPFPSQEDLEKRLSYRVE